MSEIKGWYYLHTNGELIYKADPDAITDIRDSDFAVAAWPWNDGRKNAWDILVMAGAVGAKPVRIQELAKKWLATDADAVNYAKAVNCELGEDGNQKTATRSNFVNPQESPAGFGDTYLAAMIDLCKELGYAADKLQWGAKFEDLLK